jgi:DNA polymerase-3 subunit delta'
MVLEEIHGQPEGVFFLRKVVEGAFTLPLLLVGEEGTGKRASVMLAAKEVFERDQYVALEGGHHPDFRLVEPEPNKEIKVEVIRDLVEETQALPSWAPLKFLVIDGADRLTAASANALLKALEEPPQKVRFFLLAEQSDSVIPTIRSRCAFVPYRRLSEQLLLTKLREISDDETKMLVCARLAEGSLGRAVRCLVSGQLTTRDDVLGMLNAASRKDLFAAFSAVNELTDLPLAIRFLGLLLRDVVVLDAAPGRVMNADVVDALARLKAQMSAAAVRGLLDALRMIKRRAQSPINLAFHVKAALAVACG